MLANNLKTGIRNLSRRKGYFLLNLAGLVTGMNCCLLIFHYVSFEESYDQTIPGVENLYRVRLDCYQNGKLAWKSATSYPGIPAAMKRDYPEVEDFCRLIDANLLLANDANTCKFNETQGYFAEPSFLEMFNMRLANGPVKQALIGPNKIVLSEKMAQKYYGTTQVVGKKLIAKDVGVEHALEITGVFKEHPKNSHLAIEYLISYDTFKQQMRESGDTTNAAETSFGWYDFYSYLKLKPGVQVKELESKLPEFCKKYLTWLKNANMYHEIYLTPVSSIHLFSNFNQEAEVNGNGQMVSFLFLIALLVICIAWINYINLSTARSVERAREVGMKKVLGATRFELAKQFLVENFILNLSALIISLIAFFTLLPTFDFFSGRESFTNFSLSPHYWLVFSGLFLSGTFFSGIYPAFVLSGFAPIKVLKGSFKNTSGGIVLRKSLIVLQFSVTIILITGTIIIYQQVQYMRRQNLGVNIEQTLVLKGPTTLDKEAYPEAFQPFKTELLQNPGIRYVTASSNVMGQEIYWTNGSRRLEAPKESAVTLYNLGVDSDFITAYNMKLLNGRNFSANHTSDHKTAILNEKALALLGFESSAAAISKKVRRGRDTLTVIGVVADYHHQSLQKPTDPMIILPAPNIRDFYSIKFSSLRPSETIAATEKIWNKHFPGDPFSYFFLDEAYDRQYKTDILFGKVFGIFALIAILIASFGLVGLSAYNVLQRHKEIGIRKVLGATTKTILLLLSNDFVKLIGFALLLAIPIGWYLMQKWLQDFAYRIQIHWWVFLLAGFSAMLIAASTIILQALRAVTEKPVKSLRVE